MLHPPTAPATPGFSWHHRLMRGLRGMVAGAAGLAGFIACAVLVANPAAAAESGASGRLVDPAWLQQHRDQVLLLDASMTPQHGAGHIPGAVSADRYRYGAVEPSRAAMEQRLQSWGIDAGRSIVIYDKGGDFMALRLFYDLYKSGLPAEHLFVLDGGLVRWQAQGGAVTKEPTAPPPRGSVRIETVREEVRVRLPEFLVASGDRERHVLVDALGPGHYFGAEKFFDRAGHVPHAVLMPSTDFFNADKTFKSAEEIRRLARHLGIQPGQTVHSHCGGGGAAAVNWFALHFIAGHTKVKLYEESQLEWLRDERGLPFWTYAAPQRLRDAAWLAGWNVPMLRMFGVAQLSIVDVRGSEAYARGHVPYALDLPAATFRAHLGRPQALSERLGAAGLNPAHDVVVMGEGGLTPDAALAVLALEQLGLRKVAVLIDSPEEMGWRGHELTRTATRVGPPAGPQDIAVPAVPPVLVATAPGSAVLVADSAATRGEYPQVHVSAGHAEAARALEGKTVRLPYTTLLGPGNAPKPAPELWKLIDAAGVPRHAELIVHADDPGEAAVAYVVFRLMGWPEVRVWVP